VHNLKTTDTALHAADAAAAKRPPSGVLREEKPPSGVLREEKPRERILLAATK
jgi:hypothetical protein